MKKILLTLFATLLLTIGTSHAQFAKPLPQTHPSNAESQATYNIGIIGGINTTRWFHWGGTVTQSEQPIFLFDANNAFNSILNHGTAGIVVERMLGEDNSVAIEVLYANRWTRVDWDYKTSEPVANEETDRDNPSHLINRHYHRQDSAFYHEINIQVPVTHYFMSKENNLRPFVYIAPRFTLPLSGSVYWYEGQVNSSGNTDFSVDTIPGQAMRKWNVGVALGVGAQYRINMANYYLLLKLDASAQLGIFNTYDATAESPTRSSSYRYVNPTVYGKRYIGDAAIRLTVVFPLKKTQKGACVNWGEYD